MFSFGMARHGATLRDFVTEYGERLARPHFLDMVLPLSWPSPQDFLRARFRKRWTRFRRDADRRTTRRRQGRERAFARPVRPDGPPRAIPRPVRRSPTSSSAIEVATMILAGHETTATALFWALYLLALDPATQQEWWQTKSGGQYRRRARSRSAEIHPRRDRRDDAALSAGISDRARRRRARHIAGLPVKKKDMILIAPWLLHRHEKLWRDPNAFIPSRFMPPCAAARSLCLSAVRRRPPRLHRRAFRAGGSDIGAGQDHRRVSRQLLDQTPVMPVGVVTTQPDRSPMFRSSADGNIT